MIIQKGAQILVQLKRTFSLTDGDIHVCLMTTLSALALPVVLKTPNTFFPPSDKRGKAVLINGDKTQDMPIQPEFF